jgi:hypothetical protein
MSSETTRHSAPDWAEHGVDRSLPDGGHARRRTNADAPCPGSETAIGHYDLAVLRASERWTEIRWSLFVFPDITDVAPTDDPDVVRVFFEGRRPYASVWRVQLLQTGFDAPAPDTAQAPNRSLPPAQPRRLGAGAAGASPPPAIKAGAHTANGHRSNGRRRQ